MTQTILVIDDNVVVLEQVKLCLCDKYKVRTFNSGNTALDYLEDHTVDLVIMDILMVEMDGFALFRQIQKNPRMTGIPVVFLTTQGDEALMLRAFEMGAADYIVKPFLPNVFARKMAFQLELVAKNREMLSYTEGLESMLRIKTRKMMDIQNTLIQNISALIEYRGDKVGGHISRTTQYMGVLATACLESGVFGEELTIDVVEDIITVAPLHDVGKVAIPDYILHNPDKLTKQEFRAIQNHTVVGANALAATSDIFSETSLLEVARNIALYHHERYDGLGYPAGTKGKDIPICARLMALVDAYDALLTEKPYRPSMSHEDAVAVIADGSEEQFDPDVVKIFLTVEETFANISRYQPKKLDYERSMIV